MLNYRQHLAVLLDLSVILKAQKFQICKAKSYKRQKRTFIFIGRKHVVDPLHLRMLFVLVCIILVLVCVIICQGEHFKGIFRQIFLIPDQGILYEDG